MRSANLLQTGRYAASLLALLCVYLATPTANAGSPRFVAGEGWGVVSATLLNWQTTDLRYFTDQGSLGSASHAQADSMVAAAAAVWNVPTSSLKLSKGGELGEDVSPQTSAVSPLGVTFPPDTLPANEANIPIAIIYDDDGSLIDLLLGQDASEPDGCLQNGVVGDVDDVHQNDGSLRHATLILNGRCVGASPEQLTQMQYQLMRAFGRVLGISWSQTNDDVFTEQTPATTQQMAFWPVMHPLDLICSSYTYQCMTDPFRLRTDDLNTLSSLYHVGFNSGQAGKQPSNVDSVFTYGMLYFPNGQGMGWTNVVAHRQHDGLDEPWQTVSALTGFATAQAVATPVNPTPPVSQGRNPSSLDGYFFFRTVPVDGLSNVFFTSEAINPLYMGDLSLGSYLRPPVAPSGSPATMVNWSAQPSNDILTGGTITAYDASPTCNPGHDGTETAPASLDPSGWQGGQLCGWGHSSWWSMPIAAGHQWSYEVTATDERGTPSLSKAQPVLGLWLAGDPTGTAPSVASQPVPFNSLSPGVTQLYMDAPDQDQTYRMVVSDQYGAGRPDFTYTARVLYAQSVTPTVLGLSGGQITVTGLGFRSGNQVLVNGAPAQVVSVTANEIVANAPALTLAGAQIGQTLEVAVVDPGTLGQATVPAAVSYSPAADVMQLVSAPAVLKTGHVALIPFAVRVYASDGIAPVPGTSVTFTVPTGSAGFATCAGAALCTVLTGADGTATVTVLGTATGSVVLLAAEAGGAPSVQVSLQDEPPLRVARIDPGMVYLAAGASASWTVSLQLLEEAAPQAGVPVQWSSTLPVPLGPADPLTAANGVASAVVTVTNIATGTAGTVTGCGWSVVCGSWSLIAVDSSQWRIAPADNSSAQSVPSAALLGTVRLVVTDAAGHPLQGAPVQVFQRVLAWEGDCAGETRCPSAPVLQTSQVTITSGPDGTIAFEPLQVPGVPEVVEIAAATGDTGFVTLTLVKTP